MDETLEKTEVKEMWICVHDHVFGGKSRKLASVIGCSQDEAVGLLIRLWIWGLTNCDRTGLVQYANVGTIADVLVQGLSKELNPEYIVNALIECEYLDVYDEDVIYIHDWADWQRYWYSYQDRKKNNAVSKQKSREAEQKEDKPKRPTKPRPAKSEAYSEDFEEFWKVYPRKINKVDAFAKYNARIKEGYRKEDLLLAAKNYASYVRRQRSESRYILHAETFLGPSLRFKDYIPKEEDDADSKDAVTSQGEWKNPFEEWRDDDGKPD